MSNERFQLPSMTHVFHVSVKGAETGRLYEGDFTYVRPNLNKRVEISKMRTRLNGDLKNLPLDVSIFNDMCSTLNFCISDAPSWWYDSNNGRELYDINAIETVYEETMKFEESWKEKVLGKPKGGEEGSDDTGPVAT